MIESTELKLTTEQKALLSLRSGVSVRTVERVYHGEGGPHTTKLVEQVAQRLRLSPPPRQKKTTT